MQITILCTDPNHPVNRWLRRWQQDQCHEHIITICHDKSELAGGDILFMVSCAQIIDHSIRQYFTYSLVLHASDLPQGRGWSPHVWAILEGHKEIIVSLLEAEDKVDTGHIWAKQRMSVPKHILHDEINERLFDTEIDLMNEGIKLIKASCQPAPQPVEGDLSFYPKRRPSDSKLDPDKTIREQFDQIRVADPQRYPAYFDLNGRRYKVTLTKMDNHVSDHN